MYLCNMVTCFNIYLSSSIQVLYRNLQALYSNFIFFMIQVKYRTIYEHRNNIFQNSVLGQPRTDFPSTLLVS